MELREVIEKRRSIRKFKSTPVEKNVINELLEAARLAPSGTNIQPWRFMAVTSEEMRKKLAVCTYNVSFVAQAPLTMVCCVDFSSFETKGKRIKELVLAEAFKGTSLENISAEDYKKTTPKSDEAAMAYLNLNSAIAIEHMILRGTDMSLGSCWVMMFSQRKVKELLDLPESFHVTALVPFGYPDQDPKPRPRLPLEDIFLGEV